MGPYKYKAFISYSHQDDRWGKWLHRRLENYPLPKKLVGTMTATGPIPKRLTPIFRDREELAAADNLGDKIEQALNQSENLIIICSPQAARSHWVNQEILYFKRHNRGAQIFSVIVEGEPVTSNIPGHESEECFPPALRYQLDKSGELSDRPAEPLAADFRDHADGKRLGVLKLVSGMVGLGLDEIVQRDMRRSRRRVTTVTAGGLMTMLVMGILTWVAMDARQVAEERRNEAERQIEFMLTDLKDEVKKVGRLDVMDVVVEQTANYYARNKPTIKQSDAFERLARVNLSLGEIYFEIRGSTEGGSNSIDLAQKHFEDAHIQTKALYQSFPDNPDYIFNYAQAVFWVGYMKLFSGQEDVAYEKFLDYFRLAKELNVIEPYTFRGLQEIELAKVNLSIWHADYGKNKKESERLIDTAIENLESLLITFPDRKSLVQNLSDGYAWKADLVLEHKKEDSIKYREMQFNLLNEAYERDLKDNDLLHKSLVAIAGLTSSMIRVNRFEDAQKTLTVYLPTSERLWRLNPSSKYYLENYALLNLNYAHAAANLQNYEEVEAALKVYSDLQFHDERYFGTSTDFFRRQAKHKVRTESLLPQRND